ncbi:MAG: monovalent cation/H(+) antiporter subunit G [Planctomycetota bacterium]
MSGIIYSLFDGFTALLVLSGIFFMFVGAVGMLRLPDAYCRSHAASKCVTLGIVGLLAALVVFVATAPDEPLPSDPAEVELVTTADEPTLIAFTKALLVVVFVFVAAPIGSHMLARAAHIAGVKMWSGSLGDELHEDTRS